MRAGATAKDMARHGKTKTPFFDNFISDRFVTKAELAKILHVSTKTVERMVKRGMPVTAIGGRLRFVSSEAIAWVRAQGA